MIAPPIAPNPDASTVFGLFIALQPLLIFIVGGLMAWGLWSVKQGAMTRPEHEKLERDVAGIGAKLDGFEKHCAEMPSHKEIGSINVQLAQLIGRVDSTNAELRGFKDSSERTENLVNTMHDYLLNRGRAA